MTASVAPTPPKAPARLHLSENAVGASPLAIRAAADSLTAINVYPDPVRGDLVAAIAAAERVAEEQVVVANGRDELVLLAAMTLGRIDRPGLTTGATFPGYRVCLQTLGRGVTEIPLRHNAIDLERFVGAMADAGVVFICNPHNPTGGTLDAVQLRALVDQSRNTGVPLIVDEAYLEFAPEGTPNVREHLSPAAPLLSLRTFSKAYGLAALRVGYAIGAAPLISQMRAAQGAVPFSVNRSGQAGALAALADQAHLTRVRDAIAHRRAWFESELAARGRTFLPSVTNFVAVVVDDSADVERRLETEYSILTRDAGRFGLPGVLRISLGTRLELVRALDALDAIAPVSRISREENL